ncbi:MAG: hypothetical protein Fur0022_42480 [Anaerolineales bacterium]
MKPRIKFGLLVGVVGMVLNVCVAGFMGLCGPFTALLAGGVAGFFASREEKASSKGEGARVGAFAGGIAGGLVLIGQLLGGLISLAYLQFSGTSVAFGTIPDPSADLSMQLIYYLSGLGTGLCFGLVGIVVAAATGAGAGYLSTPEQTAL